MARAESGEVELGGREDNMFWRAAMALVCTSCHLQNQCKQVCVCGDSVPRLLLPLITSIALNMFLVYQYGIFGNEIDHMQHAKVQIFCK